MALEFLPNPQNKKFVDHIDGDRKNNKLSNLRWATPKENGANKTKRANTSSKYKGVHFNKKMLKWQANLRTNGKTYHIGCYNNEQDAARAYDEKAIEFFGEFAKINFN